ncbi:hypothetical protein H4219_001260 [Mycoemilia scoparia]|uniref:RNI-like protein n=1 Tax=Mycoemilia scoparia TaxID=417184 RepID=A0A9W8A580_9FUNG|nr:hypothetical protein H4219_001260 [Mycoemilia scoparia]
MARTLAQKAQPLPSNLPSLKGSSFENHYSDHGSCDYQKANRRSFSNPTDHKKLAKSLAMLDSIPITIELPPQDHLTTTPSTTATTLAQSMHVPKTPELSVTHCSSFASLASLPNESLTLTPNVEAHNTSPYVVSNGDPTHEPTILNSDRYVIDDVSNQGCRVIYNNPSIDDHEWHKELIESLEKSHATVTHLALIRCDISNTTFLQDGTKSRLLIDYISRLDFPRLEILDLSHNHIGNSVEAVKCVVRLIASPSLRNLKTIHLGWNSLSSVSLKPIVDSILECPSFSFSKPLLPSGNSGLETLDLRGNRFGEAGLQCLSPLFDLSASTSTSNPPYLATIQPQSPVSSSFGNLGITNLYLGYNGFCPQASDTLSRYIENSASLQKLSIEGNIFRHRSKPGNTAAAADSSDNQLHCYTTNKDSTYYQLFDTIAIHPTLTHVFMPRTHLGDVGVKRLCEALRPNRAIQHLSLACNRITAQGALAIGEWIGTYSPSLVTLDLSDNPLGDSGVGTIARSLGKKPFQSYHHHSHHHHHHYSCGSSGSYSSPRYYSPFGLSRGGSGSPHLRHLILCACFISDVGVSSIAEYLSNSNRSLERINLGLNSRITHRGYGILADMAKKNPFLVQIIVGSGFNVDGGYNTDENISNADPVVFTNINGNDDNSISGGGSSSNANDDDDDDEISLTYINPDGTTNNAANTSLGMFCSQISRNQHVMEKRQEWCSKVIDVVRKNVETNKLANDFEDIISAVESDLLLADPHINDSPFLDNNSSTGDDDGKQEEEANYHHHTFAEKLGNIGISHQDWIDLLQTLVMILSDSPDTPSIQVMNCLDSRFDYWFRSPRAALPDVSLDFNDFFAL